MSKVLIKELLDAMNVESNADNIMTAAMSVKQILEAATAVSAEQLEKEAAAGPQGPIDPAQVMASALGHADDGIKYLPFLEPDLIIDIVKGLMKPWQDSIQRRSITHAQRAAMPDEFDDVEEERAMVDDQLEEEVQYNVGSLLRCPLFFLS